MNFRRTSKARPTEINLTPLVDVVLLLVLFFMVTAQFAVLPGLKLLLPGLSPESRVRVEAAERLEISLSAAGDLYFEDQVSSLAQLPFLLDRTGAQGSEVVIVLSADQAVPYGQIMKIMDTLRLEGFNRVVFAARPESEESSHERADRTP